ncbi:MAG TPA: right-handed parallel beta-helix repeat-containing protein [Kiritimatiellia bacterium]|nr:right-handed parallel beta-helix repeat-containing protein [Kiritimatiellia bacterium]
MRGFLLVLAMAVLSCPARGADFHVAPDGDDGADGLSPASAWRSLQSSVNRLDAGDTLWVHPGEYRGRVTFTNARGRADAPITIAALSNGTAILKGSEIVTNWQPAGGGVWYAEGRATNSQQVFVDGVVQQQLGWPNDYVATRACSCGDWLYIPHGHTCKQINGTTYVIDIGDPRTNMPPASFFWHAATQRLYLRTADDGDPNERVVEASVSLGVFYDESSAGHLRVRGLVFRHANTFTYTLTGWPLVLIGHNGVIEDCVIEWGDASGLTLRHNSQALRCTVRNNGMLGIACNAFTNMLVRGCTVVSNNYRGFGTAYTGGIRFIPNAGATVEDNEVAYNDCTGIWFDTCGAGHPIIVRNNHVHHNRLPPNPPGDTTPRVVKGIFIELTANAHVYNNIVASNGNVGIHLSAARDCRIEHNLITGTTSNAGGHRGVASIQFDNPLPGYPVVSNRVVNNLVAGNNTDYDIIAVASNGVSVYDNVFDHNLYHRGTGAGTAFPSSPVAMAIPGVGTFNTWAAWTNASRWDANSLTNAPQLQPGFVLAAGSPAIDRGLTTESIPLDLDGHPRPVDGTGDGVAAPDLGPREVLATGAVVYVDAQSTNPVPPYATRETAALHPADGIAFAPTGGLMVIYPGVYAMSAPLVADRPMMIQGVDAPVLDGGSNVPCLRLEAPGAWAQGLVLRHGNTPADGGAAWVGAGAVLQQSRLEHSRAGQRGGGAFVAAGGLVRHCTFTDNEAEFGGGLYAEGTQTLAHLVFSANAAALDGGGFWAGPGVRVERSRATGNGAGRDGGGFHLAPGGQAFISVLVSNTAQRGGGVFAGAGHFISEATVQFNTAEQGGGLFMEAGEIQRARVQRNRALAGDGGGIRASAGTRVVNSIVHDNEASGQGGGLFLDASRAEFCTVVANRAGEGGGIVASGPTARVVNSITWSNDADVVGTADGLALAGGAFEQVNAGVLLPGTNNLSADPQFLNLAARELRLVRPSPCIDAGVTLAGVTNDIEYKTRLADGTGDGVARPDLGAYENHQLRFVDAASPFPAEPYLTWPTAARAPQSAINVAANGDVVIVATGVYTVASPVRVNRGVVFRSVGGPEHTVLDGNNVSRVMHVEHANAVAEGFTLRRGRADAGAGAYVSAGVLRRSIITGNTSIGSLGANFAYVASPGSWYCRLAYDAVIHEGGGGVAVLHGGQVENCLIYSNTAVYGGGALSLNGGTLRHVTLSGNSASTGGGWYARSAGAIRNSIVWGNPGGNDYEHTGTSAVWQSVTALPLPPGVDASDADPLFANPAAANYRLTAGSPAIDNADPAFAPTVDLFGVPRPLDGDASGVAFPDRGAFEFIHPHADTDGDGVPDASEWVAGTGLLDAASFLQVERLAGAAGAPPSLSWGGVTGRLYSLWVSTNLLDGFVPVQTGLVGHAQMDGALPGYEDRPDLFIAVGVQPAPP